MHTKRLLVLINDTWRLANASTGDTAQDRLTGNINVELNGMIVLAKNGTWFTIDDSMSNEELESITIRNNIDQLLFVTGQKANHRRMEQLREQTNRRLEEIRAQQEVRVQQIIQQQPEPLPQPIVPTVAEDEDRFGYGYDDDFGCDCDDCRRTRGET